MFACPGTYVDETPSSLHLFISGTQALESCCGLSVAIIASKVVNF